MNAADHERAAIAAMHDGDAATAHAEAKLAHACRARRLRASRWVSVLRVAFGFGILFAIGLRHRGMITEDVFVCLVGGMAFGTVMSVVVPHAIWDDYT